MKTINTLPRCSLREEVANSIIHGVGAVLAIGGLTVLVVFAAIRGDVWHIVTVSIFGASLILLYTISTLYHAIQHDRAKSVLRILDHSAIFLLIAGTYTPFVLVSLRGPLGWTLFGTIWLLALIGIALKIYRLRRSRAWSLPLYLCMGWIALLALQPLVAALGPGGMTLLLTGGVAYTLGVVFYSWHRLPYNHAIWHVFVLLGSVSHYFAVLRFVIPGPVST